MVIWPLYYRLFCLLKDTYTYNSKHVKVLYKDHYRKKLLEICVSSFIKCCFPSSEGQQQWSYRFFNERRAILDGTPDIASSESIMKFQNNYSS